MKLTGDVESTSHPKDGCPTAEFIRGISLLQEKWSLLIVERLLRGSSGFNELIRKTESLNATTLSLRLQQLEGAGLVTKTVHSSMPPRTSYELTEAGRALEPVIRDIEAWSAAHLSSECDHQAVAADLHIQCPSSSGG